MLKFAGRELRLVLALSVLAPVCHAQRPLPDAVSRMEAEHAKEASDERQKKMLADADQLLAMAQQLKEAVDHARRDELSVQVVKQAAEIERLAKSVKDRMRQ